MSGYVSLYATCTNINGVNKTMTKAIMVYSPEISDLNYTSISKAMNQYESITTFTSAIYLTREYANLDMNVD